MFRLFSHQIHVSICLTAIDLNIMLEKVGNAMRKRLTTQKVGPTYLYLIFELLPNTDLYSKKLHPQEKQHKNHK